MKPKTICEQIEQQREVIERAKAKKQEYDEKIAKKIAQSKGFFER